MRIFLIRHGESLTNSGENFKLKLKDPIIPLTERGKRQAFQTGLALKAYLERNKIALDNARVFSSPSKRTEDTLTEIEKSVGKLDTVFDRSLICHQYGLFDALPEEDWEKLFPEEYAVYHRALSEKGKYYAKKPGGESPEDIVTRLLPFIERLKDETHDPLIIVTHGTTLRAFLVAYFSLDPTWYHKEPTPENGFIRLIENGKDKGYLNTF